MAKQKWSVWRFRIAVIAVSAALFYTAASAELFERLHELSRAHEDWELDEIFSLFLIASVAMPVLLLHQNRLLNRALHDRTEAEARAQHLSRHDTLTGLHNRRSFNEALATRLQSANPGCPPAVLLMDLDRFKPINDLRGHEAGDRLLQVVAERLKRVCRDGQVPARLGGDEFAVLIGEDAGLDAAVGLSRRILSVIGEEMEMGGWAASVSCSIGICHWTPGMDAQTLLRNADQAMYRAKRDGRSRYAFFDDALGEMLRRQAQLEHDLRIAVDRGEIEPFFQPVVELESGRMTGFEVLARWQAADGSPRVGPDIFISLAEDMGLIGAITWQVMRKACRAAAGWSPELSLAFNMSPRQFGDPELVANITRVLDETGLPADRLEIEITENAVIEDLDTARTAIEALKALGMRVSLDDFGTGFSSLATLSKLPFDRIKIDKSFVGSVTQVPQNAKIVSGILALAGSMDLAVVAEGIETGEELRFLRDQNCVLGQGFLFDRPLPAVQVDRLLAQQTAGGYRVADPAPGIVVNERA